MSPIVPCMPIPAPSVLNSELSATNADDEDVTTPSPNPHPAQSASRTPNVDTDGMHTNVTAQISNPAMISGCLPITSDTRPMIGLETKDVNACTMNNNPISPAFNPTDTP